MNLITLSLCLCPVTNVGVSYICSTLHSLESLDISWCTDVTAEAFSISHKVRAGGYSQTRDKINIQYLSIKT